MIHPTPWTVHRFAYERYAVLDANQAEVAEFVNGAEAGMVVALVNENAAAATRPTERPPFARLKAPERRWSLADLVEKMLGPGCNQEEMKRRLEAAQRRIAEVSRRKPWVIDAREPTTGCPATDPEM